MAERSSHREFTDKIQRVNTETVKALENKNRILIESFAQKERVLNNALNENNKQKRLIQELSDLCENMKKSESKGGKKILHEIETVMSTYDFQSANLAQIVGKRECVSIDESRTTATLHITRNMRSKTIDLPVIGNRSEDKNATKVKSSQDLLKIKAENAHLKKKLAKLTRNLQTVEKTREEFKQSVSEAANEIQSLKKEIYKRDQSINTCDTLIRFLMHTIKDQCTVTQKANKKSCQSSGDACSKKEEERK